MMQVMMTERELLLAVLELGDTPEAFALIAEYGRNSYDEGYGHAYNPDYW